MDVFGALRQYFKRIKGIKSVIPGYAGGEVKNPSYDQLCMGTTGHAESIQHKIQSKYYIL